MKVAEYVKGSEAKIFAQTKEILLANPRGFCAGVNRAVDIVEAALRVYDLPVYVKHEIVHNQYVVKQLESKGVIFIEDIEMVPDNQVVIFSAHGVPPSVCETAKKKNLEVIDATCPLVTKVHLESRRYAKDNFQIILIGHINHVETIGTMGEAPERTTVIESVKDVEKLVFDSDQPLAYLTQTTLSVLDTQDIITALEKKFPWIESPKKGDICYATTNRQSAVHAIADKVQILLVIGSQNSSNSNRLRELSEKIGTLAYLIEDSSFIEKKWFTENITKVGLTSGASVPEVLIDETILRLKKEFGFHKVTECTIINEDVTFQMPKNLKRLL